MILGLIGDILGYTGISAEAGGLGRLDPGSGNDSGVRSALLGVSMGGKGGKVRGGPGREVCGRQKGQGFRRAPAPLLSRLSSLCRGGLALAVKLI